MDTLLSVTAITQYRQASIIDISMGIYGDWVTVNRGPHTSIVHWSADYHSVVQVSLTYGKI